MLELMKEVRSQDPSYALIYISPITRTPLGIENSAKPVEELCIRIPFAALKERQPNNSIEAFRHFYSSYTVDQQWVKDWLQKHKCTLH
jgi:hypothetical protein